jgi:hypothetical protein
MGRMGPPTTRRAQRERVGLTPIAPVGGAGGDGPDVLTDGPNGIVGFALYNGSDVPPGVWTLK